jgi:hypothetical protein
MPSAVVEPWITSMRSWKIPVGSALRNGPVSCHQLRPQVALLVLISILSLLAIAACGEPGATSTIGPESGTTSDNKPQSSGTANLSQHISCRDLATINVDGIRRWTTPGSPYVQDYYGLEIDRDTPTTMTCKGTAIFTSGLHKERHIRADVLPDEVFNSHQPEVWYTKAEVRGVKILVVSYTQR